MGEESKGSTMEKLVGVPPTSHAFLTPCNHRKRQAFRSKDRERAQAMFDSLKP